MKKLVLITAMLLSSLSIVVAQPGVGYNSGSHYGGNVGYNSGADLGPPAMHPQQFQQALVQIRNQSFDGSRLTVARQIARSNNLRSQQVMRIMKQFSFESNRLQFAKFAYSSGSVVDIQNYHVVNQAFSFSSSVRQLDQFIASAGPAQGVGGSCGTGVSTYQSGTLTVTGGMSPAGGVHHGGGNVGYNAGANGSSGSGYYGGGHGGMNPAPAPAPHAAAGFSSYEFNCLINDLKRICFDSEKLAVAKQKICTRSLKSCEVVRIMQLFSFESSRLDFAKAAYLQTCDKQNYYLVNDAFSFSSSIYNLECYIRSL